MNYRFLKLSTLYPEFAAQFVSGQANGQSLSYQQLYEKFIGEHYGWSDYYGRHLRALGNETQEIFALEPLQKQWAKENGTRYSSRFWLRDILLAQIKAFQPDVLFLQGLYVFDNEFRKLVRETLGRQPVMIGYLGVPADDYTIFRDLDLILSCTASFVADMRKQGARAERLNHAFEPAVLEALGPVGAREFDFTFVGSIIKREGFHGQRFELVEKLLKATPLEVWGKISEAPSLAPRPPLARAATYASRALGGHRLPEGLRETLRGFLAEPKPSEAPPETSVGGAFHPPTFGLGNFRVLGRSKLTFNNHIDAAGSDAGNVRLFEATGMGACLVTDWKQNLPELLEPDSEIVVYKDAEECIEKVNYLLDHPSEYQAIAASGQRRTLRDHTFAKRGDQLDSLIRKLL